MKKVNVNNVMEKVATRGDGIHGCKLELTIRGSLCGNPFDVKGRGQLDIISKIYGSIESKSGAGELVWTAYNPNMSIDEMVEIVMEHNKSELWVYCEKPSKYSNQIDLLKNSFVLTRENWATYMRGVQKVKANGKPGKYVTPIRWKVDERGERITLQTPSETTLELLRELASGTLFDLFEGQGV